MPGKPQCTFLKSTPHDLLQFRILEFTPGPGGLERRQDDQGLPFPEFHEPDEQPFWKLRAGFLPEGLQ